MLRGCWYYRFLAFFLSCFLIQNGDTAATLASKGGHIAIIQILNDYFTVAPQQQFSLPPPIPHNTLRFDDVEPDYSISVQHISGTVSVRYSDIPLYLHNSEFYKSLSADEIDNNLEIPAVSYKENDCISSLDDFMWLIHVMSFWGVSTVPPAILQFCLQNKRSCWEGIVISFSRQHRDQKFLSTMLRYVFSRHSECLLRAIEKEFTEAVEFLAIKGPENLHRTLETKMAAKLGRIDYLLHLHKAGFAWSVDACASAAENGHIQCLKYLHEHGCKWDYTVYTGAALNGHVICINYAFDNGLQWDPDVCRIATIKNNLWCLELLHTLGCPWNDGVTTLAAQSGSLGCLRYALENGCPVSKLACTKAAAGGHIDCLRLLHDHGAEWDETAPIEAARFGHIMCIQYLYENGCEMDKAIPDIAAHSGNLEILRYIVDTTCPRSDELLKLAVESGSTACVQYLVNYCMCEMTFSAFGAAFERGFVEILQFLLDAGCPAVGYEFCYDAERLQRIGDRNFDENFSRCMTIAWHHFFYFVNEDLVNFVFHNDLPLCQYFLYDEGFVDSCGMIDKPHKFCRHH